MDVTKSFYESKKFFLVFLRVSLYYQAAITIISALLSTVRVSDGVVVSTLAFPAFDPSIWSPGPSPNNPSAFPEGVFHDFDIPFYYYNLRANAQNRVNKYLDK
jgi:hypothetical protein